MRESRHRFAGMVIVTIDQIGIVENLRREGEKGIQGCRRKEKIRISHMVDEMYNGKKCKKMFMEI